LIISFERVESSGNGAVLPEPGKGVFDQMPITIKSFIQVCIAFE